MAQKQIGEFNAASGVGATDRILLQQGSPGTPYTYASLQQLLGGGVPITAGNITINGTAAVAGAITLTLDPTADAHAVTRRYADARALTFSTIAAATAYASYAAAVALAPSLAVNVRGFYAAGDGGGGTFDFVADVTKTTSASTASGVELPIADTSSLAAGMAVVGTNIPARTFIRAVKPNASITLSANISGTVASGASLRFGPRAADGLGLAFAVTGGFLVRRDYGLKLPMVQMGLKRDYVVPVAYQTSGAVSAATTIPIADTTGIQVGMWAHHPAIAFGVTVAAVTTNTSVTISGSAVTMDSGTWVCFQPPPTDNTDRINDIMSAFGTISGGIELTCAAGDYFYFGRGAAGSDYLRVPSGAILRGSGITWAEPNSSSLASTWPQFTNGLFLHPWCRVQLNGQCVVEGLNIVRAGLPKQPPDLTWYKLALAQWTAENGVPRGSVVTRQSGPTTLTAGGNVIPLANTAGISVGDYVTGRGIPEAGIVAAITASTSVTVRLATTHDIFAGTNLQFHRAPRTMGIWFNQVNQRVENCRVLGFHTGFYGTAGPIKCLHNISECPVSFDLSGIGEYSPIKDNRAYTKWPFFIQGTYAWRATTGITVSAAGSGYVGGDLIQTETGDLLPVATVDGSGGILTFGDIIWRGGSLTAPGGAIATRCLSSDPQGSHTRGGGNGAGATVTVTQSAYTVTESYFCGVGFHLHDRVDDFLMDGNIEAGHHYGAEFSNVWGRCHRLEVEARANSGQDLETFGIRMTNTCSNVDLIDAYAGGHDHPLWLYAVDGKDAWRFPKLGQGATTFVRAQNMRISAVNNVSPGSGSPYPPVQIGPRTRGHLDGIKIEGGSAAPGVRPVVVGAEVHTWRIGAIELSDDDYTDDGDWIDIDPTSVEAVTLADSGSYRYVKSSSPFHDGPYFPEPTGPGDRLDWPVHIRHDPSATAPDDGSPDNPLTVQSMEGGDGISRTIVVARGGDVRTPGAVGYVGSKPGRLVIGADAGVKIATEATPVSGGVGYCAGSELYAAGGIWTIDAVDATGAVTAVTNRRPAAYTGADPGTVATTTNDRGGNGASLTTGVSGGAATAAIYSGGSGYYAGRVSVVLGPPGRYADEGDARVLKGQAYAGTQATATTTVSGGALTGISVSGGSGYSAGAGPTWRIVAQPGSGCTLAITPGVETEGILLAPAGEDVEVAGPLTSDVYLWGKAALYAGDGTNATEVQIWAADAETGMFTFWTSPEPSPVQRWAAGRLADGDFAIQRFGTDSAYQDAPLTVQASDGAIRIAGSVGIGAMAPATRLAVAGALSLAAPVVKTADYTVGIDDAAIIYNAAATRTVTLPAASSCAGRVLTITTVAAQAVVSASSNVIPRNATTAGTAILPATAGAWADLVSDGASWRVIRGS